MLFPAFSRMAEDRDRLRHTFLRALSGIWVASLPAAGVLIASSEPLTVLLLGEPWREAGGLLVSGYLALLRLIVPALSRDVLDARGRRRTS